MCIELRRMQKKEPPCDTCTPPLFRENFDIVRVYLKCFNQLILSPVGGVIDIDIAAVDIAVKRSNVANPDKIFNDVLELARVLIKKEANKNA